MDTRIETDLFGSTYRLRNGSRKERIVFESSLLEMSWAFLCFRLLRRIMADKVARHDTGVREAKDRPFLERRVNNVVALDP